MTGPFAGFARRLGIGRRDVRKVVDLFGGDGTFARYPGPAALVDGGGAVLAANGKAGEILPDLASGAKTKLAEAVKDAFTSGAAAAATVAAGLGQSAISVTVVPVGRNGLSCEAVLLLGRDMTLMRNLRTALTESRQRYKDLVEISSDFAWETDADGKLKFVSPRGALHYRADQLVGRDPRDFLFVNPAENEISPFTAREPHEDVTVWVKSAGGNLACLLVSCVPVFGEDGAWLGARGVARDVTEAHERDVALARARAREQLLAYIVRQVRDEIVPQNMMNAAAMAMAKGFGAVGCRIYRARPEGGFALAAQFGAAPAAEPPPASLGVAGDGWRAEKDGKRVIAIATRYRQAVNGAISLWRNDDARDFDKDDLALLAELADQIGIALQQLANHEELERLSCTDTLTGLLNRRIFIERVRTRLVEAAQSGRGGALGYVDLDNFKRVNDNFGHQRGDRVLIAVADILRGHVRDGDLAARLGGDEFAFWFENSGAAEAAARAGALRAAAAALAPYAGDAAHPIGFSIGIAAFESASDEPLDQLMARADAAMYSVKKSGKGGCAVADSAPAAIQGRAG